MIFEFESDFFKEKLLKIDNFRRKSRLVSLKLPCFFVLLRNAGKNAFKNVYLCAKNRFFIVLIEEK